MTARPVRLAFDSLPSVAPSYVRAATTLSGGLAPGETIPEIVADLARVDVRAEDVARYRKVCGFSHASTLPVTYPHVLAFPLQMAVMTHESFPLKLLGLIHVRNEISQHRAIGRDRSLHLQVRVDGHREVEKGLEFDLITQVFDTAGDALWEETSVMLSRRKEKRSKKKKKQSDEDEIYSKLETETIWNVPADIGRRYARVAGDYNPIHLSAWTAKLFGFPRAIATGMWMTARAAAALESEFAGDACTLGVAFKKPLFLPGRVRFGRSATAGSIDFILRDAQRDDIVHLHGALRYSAV